jgi:protein tyrosine phosphatase
MASTASLRFWWVIWANVDLNNEVQIMVQAETEEERRKDKGDKK